MSQGVIVLNGVKFALADVEFAGVRFVGATTARFLRLAPLSFFEGPIRIPGLPAPLHDLVRAVRREVLLGDVGDEIDELYTDLGGEG